MDTIPFASKSPAFERFRTVAQYAAMSPEDKREYDREIKAMRDYENTIEYAGMTGEKRGILIGEKRGEKRGIQIGEKKGRELERNALVESMYRNGLSLEAIAQITGSPASAIKQILGINPA